MSHSSGIPVSSGLKDVFGDSLRSNTVRLIKAEIQEEQIVNVQTENARGGWEEDLELVQGVLEKDKAAYILFRTDTEGASGYNFILFCFVPDKAKVKDKMLYASSRSNLKQQLGMNYFVDEVFGTVAADFSAKGYAHHTTSKKTDAPLTEQEQIKQQEKQIHSAELYTGGATANVHGVSFPVEQNAMDAIQQLISGSVNYVEIMIDVQAERIKAGKTATVGDYSEVAQLISNSEPRFHFYGYNHDFDGQNITSFVFIYSCPDGSKGTKPAPVKQRMLYSSSKANVSNLLSSQNVTISAKFEISATDDINMDVIHDTIHPKQAEQVKTFSKPARPGKGGARITKSDKKP